jgi:hypothetical protein
MAAGQKSESTPKRRARGTAASRSRVTKSRGTARYEKLAFESTDALERSLSSMRLTSTAVDQLLESARAESAGRTEKLARAIVGKAKTDEEEQETVRGLMEWANARTTDAAARRRTVIRAFRAKSRTILAVHGISELASDDAAAFMRSYFAEGGDMRPIAQWLAIAAGVLEKAEAAAATNGARASNGRRRTSAAAKRGNGRHVEPELFGWIKDAAGAVGNFLGNAANSVGNAISTVVDAVVKAGKSIGAALAAAAKWTAEQTTSLVRALIAAGKTAAAILNEAVGQGLLRKIVDALMRAGRAVGEVLAWAAEKAAGVVRDAVAALLAAGRTVLQVVQWAASAVTTVAHKIVRAVLDAGRSVAQIMAEVVRLGATGIRKMVAAVYAAVQKVGDILVAIVRTAASVTRTVLEGLIAAGVTLVKMVEAIFEDVAAAFQRGFIEGLIALAIAPVEILKAALATSVSMLGLAFAVIAEIFGGHRKLTDAEVAEARKIFGWSIELDRVKIATASWPADVMNWLNGQRPFTTMYIINFASDAHISKRTLIHELTHVWQAVVAGPIYMVEALHSQFFGRGYEVTAADIAAANGDIKNLEREQQAVVVERYWSALTSGSASDITLYEQLAKQVYRAEPAVPILPITVFRPGMLPIRRNFERVTPVTIAAEL